VKRFLTHIGQKDGPTHTEIRIREAIPYIIESHTRYGGDRIWEMVYLTQGIHIPQATVCQLLDLPFPIHEPLYKAAAVTFIMAEPKVCQGLHNIEEAAQMPGIYRVELDVQPGMEIKPLVSSFERCGYVLGGGETVEEARCRVLSAVGIIEIL
jgi:hypothetical protein